MPVIRNAWGRASWKEQTYTQEQIEKLTTCVLLYLQMLNDVTCIKSLGRMVDSQGGKESFLPLPRPTFAVRP